MTLLVRTLWLFLCCFNNVYAWIVNVRHRIIENLVLRWSMSKQRALSNGWYSTTKTALQQHGPVCWMCRPRNSIGPMLTRWWRTWFIVCTKVVPTLLLLAVTNKLHTGILMYKSSSRNLLPCTFSSFFSSVHDTRTYSTRCSSNLFIPFTSTSYSMYTLCLYGPCLWKSIDLHIRSLPSVGQFKSSYKRVLLSKYVT